jgi:hypothetical protein
MTQQSQQLLTSTFLFRFSVPCLYRRQTWDANGPDKDNTKRAKARYKKVPDSGRQTGIQLEPRFRIPSFGELEGKPLFADIRAAWNKSGLSFTVRVTGKKQAAWCRATRVEDSDGFHVWIDTRNTQNVHRASRYCHRFIFLPLGGGPRASDPLAQLVSIPRAREEPKPVLPATLRIRSERRVDGYLMETHIPASALTGFDPDEHSRLGFTYAVVDRELGWQTFSVGPEFPFASDPSLWGSLELQRAK